MNAAMSYPGGTSADAKLNLSAPSPTKPLWAVIGVLSMCVLALGASVVSIYKRGAEPVAPSANFLRFASPGGALGLAAPGVGAGKVITETADGRPIEISPSTPDSKPAPKNTAKPVPHKTPNRSAAPGAAVPGHAPVAQSNTAPTTSAQQSAAQPVLAQAPAQAKPLCTSCGTIEAVTPVTRPGKGSGVGMVAGGVLGAVVGNQVGSGNGRTAATVLGAVGGGWAGNAVEKNIKKDTVYNVRVRMEDGSTRTLEQASAPAVGTKVTVEGSTLRTASGAVYGPAAEQRARAPQPQAQRDIYNTGG